MSSIHAVTPANYPCDKCKKPSQQVETDVKGNVIKARCKIHLDD